MLGKAANHLELCMLPLFGEGTRTLELGPTATMSFADSSAKMRVRTTGEVIPAPPVKVVDSTGAGDTLNAVLVV